jgi:rSAM/selenodomain-associated transferase 2
VRPELISIIVPILDEERTLAGLLDHLAQQPGPIEVVVVDGGSADGGRRIVLDHPLGARLLDARRGRASQMNAGARAAAGDLLLFLHADTRLPPAGLAQLRAAAVGGALGGNFAIRWDDGRVFGWLLRHVARIQRRLGVFYGDSGIWVRRDAFEALGSYPEIPIMEDYVLARRLARTGRSARLPVAVVSSARRWRRLGIPRTVASWVVIRWAFVAGVSPERLARLYPPVR